MLNIECVLGQGWLEFGLPEQSRAIDFWWLDWAD